MYVRDIYQQVGFASSVPNNVAVVIEQNLLICMHKDTPKRVSQCHANHIFHHWMDWVQLWFLLAQCQVSLAVTKPTMGKIVKPCPVCSLYKTEELKMASQFFKKDKTTILKFSYVITTVKYKASISSHHAIPRCLKDLIEWGAGGGSEAIKRKNWESDAWFETDEKLPFPLTEQKIKRGFYTWIIYEKDRL